MRKRIEDLDLNIKTTPVQAEAELTWHTVNTAPFAVDGLPWFQENGGAFYRLPKRAQSILRESLWILGTMPSGGRVRFKTDSPVLRIRAQHSQPELAMPHMCTVGVSGLDLYEGPPNNMTFWNSRRQGDTNVDLLDVRKIIGLEQDHPSVDGVHLTDLGFRQIADGVAPVLKRILRLP